MFLKATNIFFAYEGSKTALDNINIHMAQGETQLLVGSTGSGKTTLLNVLAGILRPGKGKIETEGRVGLVLQFPENLLFGATVREELGFGLKQNGLSIREVDESIHSVMDDVGLPKSLLDRSPFSLSTGEMRKVALAAVLVTEPDLILLDEPTVGLDYPGVLAVKKTVQNLQEKGKAVLIATHRWEPFLAIAENIVCLDMGSITYSGDVRTALSSGVITTPWNLFARLMAERGYPLPYDALNSEEILKALRAGGGLP